MTTNPYATPGATLSEPTATVRLYSPVQAACGAALGGPVGLIYFLHSNFRTLGNAAAGRQTVLYGALLVVALVVVLPLLPENFPSLPFTLAYVLAARHVAERYQMSKQGILESAQHDFHSNWRVAGLGLLCLLGSAVAVILPLMALGMLGIVKLA